MTKLEEFEVFGFRCTFYDKHLNETNRKSAKWLRMNHHELRYKIELNLQTKQITIFDSESKSLYFYKKLFELGLELGFGDELGLRGVIE